MLVAYSGNAINKEQRVVVEAKQAEEQLHKAAVAKLLLAKKRFANACFFVMQSPYAGVLGNVREETQSSVAPRCQVVDQRKRGGQACRVFLAPGIGCVEVNEGNEGDQVAVGLSISCLIRLTETLA